MSTPQSNETDYTSVIQGLQILNEVVRPLKDLSDELVTVATNPALALFAGQLQSKIAEDQAQYIKQMLDLIQTPQVQSTIGSINRIIGAVYRFISSKTAIHTTQVFFHLYSELRLKPTIAVLKRLNDVIDKIPVAETKFKTLESVTSFKGYSLEDLIQKGLVSTTPKNGWIPISSIKASQSLTITYYLNYNAPNELFQTVIFLLEQKFGQLLTPFTFDARGNMQLEGKDVSNNPTHWTEWWL